MILFSIPISILAWMLGGQVNKIIRPIIIPLVIFSMNYMYNPSNWYVALPVLLYGFILTLGYGEHSLLMRLLKNDRVVRIAYSLLCCIPLIIICFITNRFTDMCGCIAIISSFLLNGINLYKIYKYDVLFDDMMRGLSVGAAIAISLL